MAVTQPKPKRPTCPSCSKPGRVCLCSRICNPGLENSIRVTVLQHSLETKHPLNSVRIAKLGFKNLYIATVSDVNLEARFDIRLIEPGSGREGLESSALDQVSEDKEAAEPLFKDVHGHNSEREIMIDFDGECSPSKTDLLRGSDLVLEPEMKSTAEEIILANQESDSSESSLDLICKAKEEAVITATVCKTGVITSLTDVWNSKTHQQKPDFDQILGSQLANDALANGFVVKKIQKKKQMNGSLELEESEEYELEIPSGSVLLYPSERSGGVDGLDSTNLKVRNLIVLDGTWAKAKKMYNENPWLKLLPHLRLDVEKMSLYSEVRREPKAGYLSTIESIVYAMKALGDNLDGLDNLLDVFESMVVDQRRCKDERLAQVSAEPE